MPGPTLPISTRRSMRRGSVRAAAIAVPPPYDQPTSSTCSSCNAFSRPSSSSAFAATV
jgi:hypothetical protein